MRTTARTSIVLSPLPDRTPREVKVLMSLAAAIHNDRRVRQAEAELRQLHPRLLADIGMAEGDAVSCVRPRVTN